MSKTNREWGRKRIQIFYEGNHYKVTILKVLEWIKPNRCGFLKVQFADGLIKNIAVSK